MSNPAGTRGAPRDKWRIIKLDQRYSRMLLTVPARPPWFASSPDTGPFMPASCASHAEAIAYVDSERRAAASRDYRTSAQS